MARKDTLDGYTITVFIPVTARRCDEAAYVEAQNVVDLINTHVKPHADIPPLTSRDIDAQTTSVCEFCGYNWSGDTPNFNGGCCADDAQAGDLNDTLEYTGGEGD